MTTDFLRTLALAGTALCLAACTTPPSPAPLPDIAEARAQIDRGALQRAHALLLPLARQRPADTELQLLLTRIRLDCLTRGPDIDDPAFCMSLHPPLHPPPAASPAPAAANTSPAPPTPRRADAKPEAAAPQGALARPVTLQFSDATLRSVFSVIGRASGLDIVFDKDVAADTRLSLQLRGAPAQGAIDKACLAAGLAWRMLDEATLLVYPDVARKQADYQALAVRSFYLAHADARFVAASLKAVLKSRDVVVDDKLNMLVVRDTLPALAQTEQLVRMHDVAEPEVVLDVQVLEVKRTLLERLGVQWPVQVGLSPLPLQLQRPGSAYDAAVPLTLRDLLSASAASTGLAVAPLTLNAQRDDTGLNMLASPRIRAKSRERARVMIGERVPNVTSTSTATGLVSESITYVDVGLKLEVEPQVYAGHEVLIKLSLEVSNILEATQTASGTLTYRIGTRNASTVLRLRDGENQLLAGLIQADEQRGHARVPGLAALPLVGRLFGNHSDERAKTEIVLSITPRLIRGLGAPATVESGFEAGTASGLRGRVDAEAAVVEAAPAAAGANAASAPVANGAAPRPIQAP